MAKLSTELRARAVKELNDGKSVKEVCVKFGISPSAVSYLKNKSSGNLPAVVEFEENFSSYQLDRLKRLVQAGVKLTEVAKDYEVSKCVIQSYCSKYGVRPAVLRPMISMKLLKTNKKKKK